MTVHLDEGTLQALADGGTPSASAARLHLEQCIACAERLAEQREAWATFTGALELLDVPAPVERARANIRATHLRGRAPARWSQRHAPLRRAAVLLLAAGGVLYAVVPGSALNAWAGGVWERVVAPAPSLSTAPVAPPPAPGETAPVTPGPTGVSVLPGPAGCEIVLGAAPATLRVRLREGDRVAVEVEGAGSALRFRTATGRVELTGVAGAEVRVALPRVGASTIRVGDRVYLLQEDAELRFPGPPAERADGEIVFTTDHR